MNTAGPDFHESFRYLGYAVGRRALNKLPRLGRSSQCGGDRSLHQALTGLPVGPHARLLALGRDLGFVRLQESRQAGYQELTELRGGLFVDHNPCSPG